MLEHMNAAVLGCGAVFDRVSGEIGGHSATPVAAGFVVARRGLDVLLISP
jgi:hypothetical protein